MDGDELEIALVILNTLIYGFDILSLKLNLLEGFKVDHQPKKLEFQSFVYKSPTDHSIDLKINMNGHDIYVSNILKISFLAQSQRFNYEIFIIFK